MAKKKKNKLKSPLVFLTSLFLLIIVFFGINFYYEKKTEEFNDEIFKTVAAGGFTLFDAYPLKEEFKKEEFGSGVNVWLKPGEIYRGKFGIKNHDPIEHQFAMHVESFILSEVEAEGEVKIPILSMNQALFNVGPRDVTFFDYTVKVPEDILTGKYKGSVSTKAVDKNAKTIYDKERGMKIELAMGVPVNVIVVDGEKPEYEYDDYSTLANGLAMKDIFNKFRYLLGAIFLIATGIFLYKAFKAKN